VASNIVINVTRRALRRLGKDYGWQILTIT
jgi:hypothetical protein